MTIKINFSKINPFGNSGSARDAFEELVVQLARRESHKNAVDFQANNGNGGDGGVEAFHTLSDGTKIGYQAKYFLKSCDSIQWKQMDKSIDSALKVHPQLTRYIFALPHNLRPDLNNKKNSEEKTWKTHVTKWKKLAKNKNIDLKIELWDENTLKNKLLQPENYSLIRYYFGKDILDLSWFAKRVESATINLDDRFNPEDHVEIELESLFNVIVRDFDISSLELSFKELKEATNAISLEGLHQRKSYQKEFKELQTKLLNFENLFTRNFNEAWNFSKILEILNEIEQKLPFEYELEKCKQNSLENLWQKIKQFRTKNETFKKLILSDHLKAEKNKCALIHGDAGAGKSHLLGQIAQKRIKKNQPTILILGQELSDKPFWQQFSNILGLDISNNPDEILSLLNAVGEQQAKALLLLFDAINEGIGAKYWRNNFPSIINEIKKYPYLRAVFSCRSEYLPYAIPKNLNNLPKFLLKGFFTPEEQEKAAKQYLDAKSIVRPDSLWFSPEFKNPLFLKTVVEALHEKGETEFPRGLHGISSLIALYLKSLCWRLEKKDSNPEFIYNSLCSFAKKITEEMAHKEQDFVELSKATQIVNECFQNCPSPNREKNWLEILMEGSLLRKDPAPHQKSIDPLDPPPERIRITFQKFQDHLMAEALVSKIKNIPTQDLFLENGPLSFLFLKDEDDSQIHFHGEKYAGLLSSLCTIYPEKTKKEFLNIIPNLQKLLGWSGRGLEIPFIESLKWRKLDSFSPETKKLSKQLVFNFDEELDEIRHGVIFFPERAFDRTFNLLLDVVLVPKHPFNAFFLHKKLKQWDMSKRDHFWTQWISRYNDDEQIKRIISWALDAKSNIKIEYAQLAALLFFWCLASTDKILRDQCTKALTTLLLASPEIFDFLLKKIDDCDDPYITERFYAAAFGACCIDPKSNRLKPYAKNIFEKIFQKGTPPLSILTRDYALGIIELAKYKNLLPESVKIKECYPPFNSQPPIFDPFLEKNVEELTKERCGYPVSFSILEEEGGFGENRIPERIGSYLNTLLKDPKSLLSKQKRINIQQCRLWITKQVYNLGWCDNLFPEDSYLCSSDGQCLESFAEKYQRIALDELEARLADNYCLIPNESPTDRLNIQNGCHHILDTKKPISFSYNNGEWGYRDIDPTILPTDNFFSEKMMVKPDHWIFQPVIPFEKISEDEYKHWLFEKNWPNTLPKIPIKQDQTGNNWIILHEEINHEIISDVSPTRHQEFRKFYCILIKKNKFKEFIKIIQHPEFDRLLFYPKEFTNAAYLYELYWRQNRADINELEFIIPLANYQWEMDGSLPGGGYSIYLLETSLARELNLSVSKNNPKILINENEEKIFLSEYYKNSEENSCSAAVINEEIFNTCLEKFNLKPIWLMSCEKNTGFDIGKPSKHTHTIRRIIWQDNSEWKHDDKIELYLPDETTSQSLT